MRRINSAKKHRIFESAKWDHSITSKRIILNVQLWELPNWARRIIVDYLLCDSASMGVR